MSEVTGRMINQLPQHTGADAGNIKAGDNVAAQDAQGKTVKGKVNQVVNQIIEQTVNQDFISEYVGDKRLIPGPSLNSATSNGAFEGSSPQSPTDEAVKHWIARLFDDSVFPIDPPKPGTIFYTGSAPGIPGTPDSPQRSWFYASGTTVDDIQITRMSRYLSSFDVTEDEDAVGEPLTPAVFADANDPQKSEILTYINANTGRIRNGDFLYYTTGVKTVKTWIWACIGDVTGGSDNVLLIREPNPTIPPQADKREIPQSAYNGNFPTSAEVNAYIDQIQGGLPVGTYLVVPGNSQDPCCPDYAYQVIRENTDNEELAFITVREPQAPAPAAPHEQDNTLKGDGTTQNPYGVNISNAPDNQIQPTSAGLYVAPQTGGGGSGGTNYSVDRYAVGELRYKANAGNLTYTRNGAEATIDIPAGTKPSNIQLKITRDFTDSAMLIHFDDANGFNDDPDNDMMPICQGVVEDNFNVDPPTQPLPWNYKINQSNAFQFQNVGYVNGRLTIRVIGVNANDRFRLIFHYP